MQDMLCIYRFTYEYEYIFISQILEHDFLHFRCYYLLSTSFALSQEYLHNMFVVSERQKER
jgi:hypothetical protein